MGVRIFLAASATWATAAAVAAEPVATLHSHNGTLPPPYHRSLSVSIEADGRVTLKDCTGYDESGCSTFTGEADGAALAAIDAAARTAGCPGNPLTENDNPPVGGGASSGGVLVDGTLCALPPYVIAEDEARKASVIAAIGAAIPASLTSVPGGAPSE